MKPISRCSSSTSSSWQPGRVNMASMSWAGLRVPSDGHSTHTLGQTLVLGDDMLFLPSDPTVGSVEHEYETQLPSLDPPRAPSTCVPSLRLSVIPCSQPPNTYYCCMFRQIP